MAWQLIFTSSPRGLMPGNHGLGIVACHREIRDLLVKQIERLSYYKHLAVGPNAAAPRNPSISAHRIVTVQETTYHLLTRIQDCGFDYSHRTNYLAHHLVCEERELAQAPSPAEVLLAWKGWRNAWEGEPRFFNSGESVDLASIPPTVRLPATAWESVTGNAGHAALICHAGGAANAGLVMAPGEENRLLALYAESLLLLEGDPATGASRWQTPFTTFLQMEDHPADFKWIGVWPDRITYLQGLASAGPVLDLRAPGALPAIGTPLAEWARTGTRPPTKTLPASGVMRAQQRPAPLPGRADSPSKIRASGAVPRVPSRRFPTGVLWLLVLGIILAILLWKYLAAIRQPFPPRPLPPPIFTLPLEPSRSRLHPARHLPVPEPPPTDDLHPALAWFPPSPTHVVFGSLQEGVDCSRVKALQPLYTALRNREVAGKDLDGRLSDEPFRIPPSSPAKIDFRDEGIVIGGSVSCRISLSQGRLTFASSNASSALPGIHLTIIPLKDHPPIEPLHLMVVGPRWAAQFTPQVLPLTLLRKGAPGQMVLDPWLSERMRRFGADPDTVFRLVPVTRKGEEFPCPMRFEKDGLVLDLDAARQKLVADIQGLHRRSQELVAQVDRFKRLKDQKNFLLASDRSGAQLMASLKPDERWATFGNLCGRQTEIVNGAAYLFYATNLLKKAGAYPAGLGESLQGEPVSKCLLQVIPKALETDDRPSAKKLAPLWKGTFGAERIEKVREFLDWDSREISAALDAHLGKLQSDSQELAARLARLKSILEEAGDSPSAYPRVLLRLETAAPGSGGPAAIHLATFQAP